MDIALMIIGSVCVGIVVGIFSGMLGIGGGTILIPVFKLGYAMQAIVCTATSLFTIIPTAISGAITHIRNKTCIPKLGVVMGIGGAITSPLGVTLANQSPSWLIMLVAACIILYSAYTMLRKALKAPKNTGCAFGRQAINRTTPESQADTRETPNTSTQKTEIEAFAIPAITPRFIVIGLLIGCIAGFMGGYVGVGGGFIMVPLMMTLLNAPMKLTSGTSLIAIVILSTPGVITQALLGNVNWIVGIAVAAGSIPGATIGARVMSRIPERTLRFLFSAFLFVAAFFLVLNELHVF